MPRESQPFKFGCSATALRAARIGSAWRGVACVGRERAAGSSGRSRCCPQASTRSSPSTGVSVSLRRHCGATSQRMQPCAMQHDTPPDRSACNRTAPSKPRERVANEELARGACATLRVVATRAAVRRWRLRDTACLPNGSQRGEAIPTAHAVDARDRAPHDLGRVPVTRVEYPEYDHALVVCGRTECAGR